MTKKMLHFAQLVLLIAPISLFAQSVAFTFDDGFDPRKQEKATEWNQAILNALKDASLQSILFPIGNKVELLNPCGTYLLCDHFYGEGGMQNNQLYMTVDEQLSSLDKAGFEAEVLLKKGSLVLVQATNR